MITAAPRQLTEILEKLILASMARNLSAKISPEEIREAARRLATWDPVEKRHSFQGSDASFWEASRDQARAGSSSEDFAHAIAKSLKELDGK